MRTPWLLLPLLFTANASCTLLLLPDAGAGDQEIQAVGPSELEGAAGSPLPQPVTVVVVDGRGREQAGVPVVFEAAAGGAAGAPQQVTDSQGRASTSWRLGPGTGTQTLTARLAALGSKGVVFQAQAQAGPATHIEPISGSGQAAAAGEELAQPLVVRVLDAHQNPVPGATLKLTPSGGTVGPPQPTGVPGEFRFRWRLGTATGSYSLAVSGGAGSEANATFSATAVAGAPARIERVAGNGQTGVVGQLLSEELAVRVLDAHGNAVAGAVLTPTSDLGTPVLASATTGPTGELRFGWRLGEVAKSYTITVAASTGSAAPATFNVLARAGALHELVILSGNGQSVLEGSTLPDSLVVRARDAYGNPVSGAAVSWVVTAGGGTVAPGTPSTTRTDGTARAAWSVGIDLPNRVRASAGAASLEFEATALPRTPRVWVTVTASPAFTPPVRYLEIRMGEGTATPTAGQVVSLYYTAYREDGSVFQRVRRGVDPPLQFQFGTSPLTVLRALDAGVAGMRRGGVRRIYIPQEHTDNAGSALFFEVEMASFAS